MLTDSACKSAACPPDKPHKRHPDAEGLYLEVRKNGGKYWFLKYRVKENGAVKETRMSFGVYPKVTLKEARVERAAAKLEIAKGRDPSKDRKSKKQQQSISGDDSFRSIALAWHTNKKSSWSVDHADRTLRQMERDLFPIIGDRPIKDLRGTEILYTLKKVEERGAIETADRGLMICRQIYDYVALDDIPDATRGIKAKLQPYRGKKFAAILEPKAFGKLLKAIDLYHGGIVVKTALQLAPILFQRPLNLRLMKWAQIDFEEQLWTIPSSEMKRTLEGKENGEPHYVPLPTQAIKLISELKPFVGNSEYVFRGERQASKPISDNSVRTALYSLGFGKEQSWHGFRASGRTMLAEQLDEKIEHLEAQLAHAVKDANGTSYNRAIFIKQRRPIMQRWADYLDQLKDSDNAPESTT
ncbi:integrase arm-type DNA-binding domain-containing protein [Polynucleobacter paneuropaeus]|nr:integrase arm-type DNA-binding domain-containing protein [Polynucleobacter paneuropaeus]